MAGSYHGSILKIDMNCQVICIFNGLSWNVIPLKWKQIVFDYSDINENDLCQNHHLIKGARILPLDKLSSNKIYLILRSNIVNKPTSNIYFEKSSENITIGWNKIYLSPHLATIDTIDTIDVLFNIKFLIRYFFSTKKTMPVWNNKCCSLLFL